VRNYHALERRREENDLEILEDKKLLRSLKTCIYIKQNNIEAYLKEIISKTVNWTHFAQKMIQWPLSGKGNKF
jgi:hypothetical protein